jgi:DNA-binding transcriptional MocR family regulator
VLYCGSFSKTLSPGLRVGWAIPGRYQHAFEHLKLVVNQSTATAPQLAIASFMESGGFEQHVRRIRHRYRQQMDSVISAVDAAFPSITRHTAPSGGHVLWIQVPGLDSLQLYEAAAEHGIHIAPGPLFSASRGYLDFIRLNTGFTFTSDTERQINTLGELINTQLRTT